MTEEKIKKLETTRRGLGHYVVRYVAVLVTFVAIYIGTSWGIYWYEIATGEARVQNTVDALRKFGEEDYARAMADTYGGKTPQETLQMYIDAVEKGGYELASKYFIGDKQDEELNKLNNTNENKKDLEIYLEFVKTAKSWRSSLEDKNFVMEAKTNLGPSIFIRFKIYPNGI